MVHSTWKYVWTALQFKPVIVTCLWTASFSWWTCRTVLVINNNIFCWNNTSLWHLRTLFQHLWKQYHVSCMVTTKQQITSFTIVFTAIFIPSKFLAEHWKCPAKPNVWQKFSTLMSIECPSTSHWWTSTSKILGLICMIPCWQEYIQE